MSQLPPDIWDALAEWVPAVRRSAYWQTVARLRQLRTDDEILLLVEAMGVLALVTSTTPKALAAECEHTFLQAAHLQIEAKKTVQEISSVVVTASNDLTRAVAAFDKAVAALTKTAARVEASAATVRQGLLDAPSQVRAYAISQEISGHLEASLVGPAEKAVKTMAETISKLPAFAQEAKTQLESLKDFNVFWHYLNAVLTALGLACVFTFLFKGCTS